MTGAERKRTHRAIAGALASVDELWSLEALDGLIERNGGHSLEVLREKIISGLCQETELGVQYGAFEPLLEAVRMNG